VSENVALKLVMGTPLAVPLIVLAVAHAGLFTPGVALQPPAGSGAAPDSPSTKPHWYIR
jgi:hypothetical protein